METIPPNPQQATLEAASQVPTPALERPDAQLVAESPPWWRKRVELPIQSRSVLHHPLIKLLAVFLLTGIMLWQFLGFTFALWVGLAGQVMFGNSQGINLPLIFLIGAGVLIVCLIVLFIISLRVFHLRWWQTLVVMLAAPVVLVISFTGPAVIESYKQQQALQEQKSQANYNSTTFSLGQPRFDTDVNNFDYYIRVPITLSEPTNANEIPLVVQPVSYTTSAEPGQSSFSRAKGVECIFGEYPGYSWEIFTESDAGYTSIYDPYLDKDSTVLLQPGLYTLQKKVQPAYNCSVDEFYRLFPLEEIRLEQAPL